MASVPPIVSLLANNASLEVPPGQLRQFSAALPPGAEVYVPFLPKARWQETVQACQHLRCAGMVPVPHLTARSVASAAELDDRLGALAAAQVDRLLLIAGDQATPAGPYADVLAVLETGKLLAHGLRRIGVAAHPEGGAHAPKSELDAALARKLDYAANNDVSMWVVTQFVFAAKPALEFLQRLRCARPTVPVRLGIPGPTRLSTLIAFASRCGVGASLRTLTRRPETARLLAQWSPNALFEALAEHPLLASEDVGIHVFAFGGVGSATGWLQSRRSSSREEPSPMPPRQDATLDAVRLRPGGDTPSTGSADCPTYPATMENLP